MDLRQLEYLQTVAKLRNVTRAAEQMHVSQSTVTLAIQRLEDELGVLLFDRSQKQLSLTAEGYMFVQKISDVLSRLQDAVEEVNDYRQLKKGTLRLGVPPMIGSYLFPAILAGFKKRYPDLQLITVEEHSLIIRQMLERGELDLGIINLYQPSPYLEAIKIIREQFVACLPLDHPLANKATLCLEDIKNDPFIFFKESAYNRKLILEEFEKCGISPNIVLSTDQIETMKGLVAKGVGISFLIEGIAKKSTEFLAKPLAHPLYIDFGLAWKRDRHLSIAAQAFIELIAGKNTSGDISNPTGQ